MGLIAEYAFLNHLMYCISAFLFLRSIPGRATPINNRRRIKQSTDNLRLLVDFVFKEKAKNSPFKHIVRVQIVAIFASLSNLS